MNETNQTPESDLREEFRSLGDNLRNAVHTAWESEERKTLQTDIENGLTELGYALTSMVKDFSESDAGKQFKKDVKDFGEKVRTGEVEEKARSELLYVLKKVNAEINNAIDMFVPEAPEDKEEETT